MRSRTTRSSRLAQRVAGGGVLEAGQRDDVAGTGLLDVFARIGMHQQHAADPFTLFLHRVLHIRAGLENARIDAHEGERADERIVHDLEGEARERFVVGRVLGDLDFVGLSNFTPLIAGMSIGAGR